MANIQNINVWLEKEIAWVSSCWALSGFADGRMMKVVFVVATRNSPQEVRSEDGRERRRTSNRLVRIPAELRCQNWRKPHFLHERTTRIPRSRNPGWHQRRSTSKRRYSWNHRNRRDNRLQYVYRNRVWFISDLENQKISQTIGALDKVLCTEEIKEVSRRRHRQKQIWRPAELKVEAETEIEELHDIEEVRRNPRLPAQLDREKSLEEFQSVRGTCLVEIKQNQKLLLLERM